MNFKCLGGLKLFKKLMLFLVVFSFALNAYSATFVLGKQYLLKPKRQLSSLVWYAVTFDKSVIGGLQISLKVFSEKGKRLEFLDEFRDFVSDEIAQRCISKFSMTNYRMDFNEQKRSELEFQVNSIKDIIYIPLKVKYANGFEDYLVRIRIKNGKFAISTRPLQQGRLTVPEENAVENYRAEQLKEKDKLKKKEQSLKNKAEADKKRAQEKLRAEEEKKIRNTPAIDINDELFSPESGDLDKLLKESEAKFKIKEAEAKEKMAPTDSEADLYKQPLQRPSEVLKGAEGDSNAQSKDKTDPKNSTDDTGLDALFKSGGAATKPTVIKSTNPELLETEELTLDDDEFEKKDSPAKKQNKKVETEAAFDDDEIVIEGFDEALQEIERLEGLEEK